MSTKVFHYGKVPVELSEACPRKEQGRLPENETCPCQCVPDAAVKALQECALTFAGPLRWNHVDGCYLGTAGGMTVGVELDGYIHS